MYGKKVIAYLIPFLLLIISSCVKEIEIQTHHLEERLVLNSILCPDSQLVCYVSSTASITDNYKVSDNPTHIKLYGDNNLLLDTIIYSDTLITGIYPKGLNYEIHAHRASLDTIKAADYIPSEVQVDSAIMTSLGVGPYGGKIWDIEVSFTDPPGQRNYYEVMLAYIYSREPHLRFWPYDSECAQTDPVLNAEGDIDYYPRTYFFSDELFDGESYTLKIRHSNVGWSERYGVILRSVSRNYYLYKKHFTRHDYNKQIVDEIYFYHLLFLGEPQNAYTNIQNGYGIFASYCNSNVKEIQIIE